MINTANSEDLKFENWGCFGLVTLNRPQKLNALNSNMIDELTHICDMIELDKDYLGLILIGAGDRAFCAGGDIVQARQAAIKAQKDRQYYPEVIDFFRREYALNQKLFSFSKLSISLMQGITMGGGVGLANACNLKISSEKINWAMPEVTIGFFPDVGASHYLNSCPNFMGRYLALTGSSVKNPFDLKRLGLADHVISQQKWAEFLNHLRCVQDFQSVQKWVVQNETQDSQKDDGFKQLSSFCVTHFSKKSLSEILQSLSGDHSPLAQQTLALIGQKSPTSLAVTMEHLLRSEQESFSTSLARDLHLAGKFMASYDFIEGVRAAVVDKDYAPKWNPDLLDKVDIRSYFM
jgi:enoyl-CoA hydratase/carnithine racemase